MKILLLLSSFLLFLQGCINFNDPSELKFEAPEVGGNNYFAHCDSPPIELSESFRRNCASCHGQEGQGHSAKTLTNTTHTYDSFLRVTRGEVKVSTGMPSFDDKAMPTDDLLKNYIALHHDRYLRDCSNDGSADPDPSPQGGASGGTGGGVGDPTSGGTSGGTGGGIGDPIPEDPKFTAFKKVIYQNNACLNCHGPNTAIDFTRLRTADDWLNSPFVTAGKPNLSTVYAFMRGVEQPVPGRTFRVMPPVEAGPSLTDRNAVKAWIESTAPQTLPTVVDEDFDSMTNFTSTASVGSFSLVQEIGKSLRLSFASPLNARAIEHVIPVGANKNYRLSFDLKNQSNTTLVLKVLEDKKSTVLRTLSLPQSSQWSSYSTEFSTNGFIIQNGKSWANFRVEVGTGAAGRNVTVDNVRLIEVTE